MRTIINDRARDEEVCRWVSEKVETAYEAGNQGIAVELDGRLVAGVLLNDFNGENVFAHLRVDTPIGMTRPFLNEVFDYVFHRIGAKRMTAPCVQTSQKAMWLLLRMGFQCEAILRDFCKSGHLYFMVMWPDKCKYLENNHG